MGSATTQADVIPPVPGANGAISISYVTTSSLVLNWTKAVDNYTPQSALRYEIRKSLSNNIGSLASIKNGSIIKAFTNDISTISVDGLLPNTTYYFNITVMDSSGNKATYSMANATTMVDNTGPIPGASGAITFSGTTLQETIVNWSRASDHVTYFEDLEYALYYSTSANISSVTQAETNGTLLMDYTVDTITFPMTDLVPGTKYYKLVMVDHPGTNREGRSVHAFIARQTGAVYKPASFRAPAKHVRYNLLDEVSYETCLHNADWAGAYLYMN
mgnify:CR=1 FL=1